jgi:hypothetical protein
MQRLADLAGRTDGKVAGLTGGRIRVDAGTPRRVPLDAIAGQWENTDRPVVSVGMTLMERPTLRLLMLFDGEARDAIAEAVLGARAASDRALADSVIQEVGNIFGTAVANALAAGFDEPVRTSTPELAQDMVGSLVGATLVTLPDVGDEVLMLGARLRRGTDELPCRIHLFLEESPLWRRLDGSGADAAAAQEKEARTWPGY